MSIEIVSTPIVSAHSETKQARHDWSRYGASFACISLACGGKAHRAEADTGYNNSGERGHSRDKPSALPGGALVILWGTSVFLFPMLSTLFLGGPVAAMMVAAWEIAVALVVLLMMGARLGSIVKDDR